MNKTQLANCVVTESQALMMPLLTTLSNIGLAEKTIPENARLDTSLLQRRKAPERMKTMNAPLLISAAGVEIYIFIAACVVFVCGFCFLPDSRRDWLHWGSIAAVLVAAFAAMAGFDEKPVFALNGFFCRQSVYRRFEIGGAFFPLSVSLAFSRHFLRYSGLLSGEFYFLVLTATLGMLVMVSAAHLLSLYLGLEIMSLSMYSLIALKRDGTHSSEAAIKYFILGALGFRHFSLRHFHSLRRYRRVGHFRRCRKKLSPVIRPDKPLCRWLWCLCWPAPLSKWARRLFHMWLPDVYQGAPAPVTLFIASGPKNRRRGD